MRAPSASSTSALPHARGDRAVAVLGDRDAGAGRPRTSTSVEMLKVRAPSPPVPQVSMKGPSGGVHRRACGAHRRGEPGDLVGRLALRAAARPGSRRSGRRRASPDMIASSGGRGAARGPRSSPAQQPVDASARSTSRGHGATALTRGQRSRKFASSGCPRRVRIDSGWNCTPSTGRLAVAHAHDDVAVAAQAVTSRSGASAGSTTSEW